MNQRDRTADSKREQLKQAILQQRLQKNMKLQAPGQAALRIAPIPRDRPLALSYAQQRLWFLAQLDQAASAAYHMPAGLRLVGRLDKAALLGALERIVERHEDLRTVFVSVDGEPVQQVREAGGFVLGETDLGALADAEREAAVDRIAGAEVAAPFDLARGPLIRGQLLRLRDDEHILLITQHHIVSDGWSINVLVGELSAIYAAFVQGQPDPLPPLAIQYADYAAWQRGWLQGDVLQGQIDFWRAHLHGAPTLLTLPTDRPRPAAKSYGGGSVPFTLDAEQTGALRALSQRHGTTLFMTLLAGWAILLARLSGQQDVVIGTPVANRRRSEVEPLIGFFVNTLALRVRLEQAPTVAALLAQVKASTLGAYDHQDLPFEQIVDIVQPARSMSHSPVFQVMLSMNNAPGTSALNLQGLSLSQIDPRHDSAQFDLSLSLIEGADTVTGKLIYASELFDAATIARFSRHFKILLQAMCDAEHLGVQQLPLLSGEERQQLLAAGAARSQFTGGEPVHRRFERQAALNGEAVALVCDGETLSYAALNRRANRIAHHLIGLGVRPNDRVALCSERGFDMLAGLLGILKAGAGYVPLDPAYPADRLAYMLEDSTPVAMLTQSALLARLPTPSPSVPSLPTLLLDAPDTTNALSTQADHNPHVAALSADSLAYVIYTSGSTGKPKGVMVSHGNVARLFDATHDWFKFGPADVWTLFHSFAFDFSVWEIWGALCHGGKLVVVPSHVARSPHDFYTLLCREGVTVLNQTPSAFRQLSAAQDAQQHSLRCIVFGGEALDLRTLRPWIERNDPLRTRLVNMYGITEITVHATYRALGRADIDANLGSVIGAALPDLQMYLLDANLQPVPLGVTGELYIGGAGVARGYLNREELTAERFIADPFGGPPGARLYKTGDLARRLADGDMEYQGRNDFQVKIRGFRIELGEIEARLAACAGVREAVVVARTDAPGEQRLVAYLIADDAAEGTAAGAAPTAAALREQLLVNLADYMVPSAFVTVTAFPLTTNGKLDTAALPAPDASALAARAFAPPQGAIEAAIAAIWCELLNLEQVGRNDNFFELGGHSLMVVRLIERLRQQGLSADVRAVFDAPTLAALAAAVGAAAAPAASSVPPNLIGADCTALTPELLPLVDLSQAQIDAIVASVPQGAANIQDIYPLSPLQEGILFHHLLEKEGDAYLTRSVITFDSRARLDAFTAALQSVIDRHDILRSSVRWAGLAEPVQLVQRSARLSIAAPALDAQQDALAQLMAHTDPRHTRLDLRRAPLMAAYIGAEAQSAAQSDVQSEAQSGAWHLVLLSHHMIDDNYSMQIILAEIQAFLQGVGAALPEPLPYRNFIASTRSVAPEVHEAYFRTQLAHIDTPTAPFGLLDVQGSGEPVREIKLTVDGALALAVRAAARQFGVSPGVLFHTAWGRVMGQCSGQDEVVFGTVLSGRLQGSAGADRVIGMFINTLPLRVSMADASVREAVAATFRQLSDLLAHEQAPLSMAQRCSGVSAGTPLFTSLFNYRHSQADASGSGIWEGISVRASEERTNYPVTMAVNDLGQDFALTSQCHRVDPARVAGYLVTALEGLVGALADNPDASLLSVPVMPPEELAHLLYGLNATRVDYAQSPLVHELFEQWAAAEPDAIAVLFEDQRISYADLNRRANRLAHHLLTLGVKPDDRVAIFVERNVEMIVGLLAILKAGGAYVPLDPAYPADRVAFMLSDSAPRALLTLHGLRDKLPATALPVVLLDRAFDATQDATPDAAQDAAQDAPTPGNPSPAALGLTARHLSYVIYTSGSTGVPKGVMVEHGNTLNFILWARTHFKRDLMAQTLFSTSINFDISVFELFTPLSCGAAIRLVRDVLAPDAIIDGITLINTVQSAMGALLERGTAPPSVQMINLSGEALKRALVERIFATTDVPVVANLYGPTETTTFSTWVRMERKDGFLTHIGRPIANTQIYVLDKRRAPVPVGVVGEIFIGGDGVTRGYLGRPELSAERFVADRFGARAGAMLYKTGDLGRWLEDGHVEYLGRNDFQVKIRGFRIELGEIESRLACCAGVHEALVVVNEDATGEKRLIAYVSPQPGAALDPAALRAELALHMADYMLPSAFVMLDAFPLMPNGKLDRLALPAADMRALGGKHYQAPQGPLEEAIAVVWQEMLNLERVGRHDNFFELGGHSLLVVRLIERLRRQDMTLDVAAVFAAPTPALMAVAVAGASGAVCAAPPNLIAPDCTRITPAMLPLLSLTQLEIDAVSASVPGGAANIGDMYPLGPLQEGILFHHLLNQEGDAYLLRSIVAFDTRARLDAFLAALDQVVARHDILRSAIRWAGLAQPIQVVLRHAPLPVHEVALNGAADAANAGSAEEQLQALTDPRHVRLDLQRAPLLAAYIGHDEHSGEWLLSLLHHHLVCDHVTVEFMLGEIQAIFKGQAALLPAALPYRHFIAQNLAVPAAAHEAYFRRRLGDVVDTTAAFGVLDVQGDGTEVEEVRVELDAALARAIGDTARARGVSAAVLVHVAMAQVLAKCSGRDDVVFGTVLSGRLQGSEGADQVLGMFINTLPLRVSLGGRGVAEAIGETYTALSELLSHEQASLAMAQRCSGVAASAPLFTTLLNYRHSPRDDSAAGQAALAEAWQGIRVLASEERTNYPITVTVDHFGQGFAIAAQCVRGIDAAALVSYLGNALAALVQAASAHPDLPMAQVSILSPQQRRALLPAAVKHYPVDALVQQRFERQAALNGEAVALVCDGETLSYAALNRRANRIAHHLIGLGVRPNDRVALCSERGFDMLAGLLGILKAGAGYVPLDPAYPADRLAYMLDDSTPVAMLTQSALLARLPAPSPSVPTLPTLLLDAPDTTNALSTQADHNPHVAALSADSLAYVIYTSGSTGKPKGVMVSHGNVARLFDATHDWFNFGPADVWTLFHSFAFDFSVWEIWGALCHGGKLVVVPSHVARSPHDFYTLLCREGVTVLNQTPSAFRQLSAAQDAQQHSLRCIVFGGEALDLRTLRPWIERNDPLRTRLVNMYGITEITVHATYRALGRADIDANLGSVIGAALPDLQMYLLDADLQPVPLGVTGELYIGGAGVARGYLNREELTAERFIADPFGGAPGARLYKTGDLARRLADGDMEYQGRNDFQVKIRGFRIELGEIEARLAACAGVREAVVVARTDAPGEQRLVAYLIADDDAAPTAAALREQLLVNLADYMVPSAFVTVAAFPLTTNGKLDTAALPAPDASALAARAFAPPQGAIEAAIAAIWCELLNLEQVGRNDNFFELGGHSLMVVRLIERLRQQGLSADVRAVFDAPTLAALAAAVGAAAPAASSVPPNLIGADCTALTPDLLPLVELSQAQIDAIVASVPQGAANIQDIYPLSPLQEGILFHHLLEQEGDAYLMRSVITFDSRARLDSFTAALQSVIDRHDILRTTIRWEGLPLPLQIVLRAAPLSITALVADRQAPMACLLDATDPRRMHLDLVTAPLMALYTVEDGTSGAWHVALLNHHIIDDNYSMQIILREIQAFRQGQGATLAPSLPYRDFIASTRAVPVEEHAAYFRAQLSDIDAPTAPFGLLNIQGGGEHVREAKLTLDADLALAVRAAARQCGVSPGVLFHTAWGRVVGQCSGRDEVVFGTVLSGRLQGSAGADRVIGMFINTLPLRVSLADASVGEAVAATYRALSELLAHEQASLTLAQACSGVAAPMPLFTTLLNYRHSQNNFGAEQRAAIELAWEGITVNVSEERTNYPIGMSIDDDGENFVFTAQCDAGIDPLRLAHYLRTALAALTQALAHQPELALRNIDVLADDELARLRSFNDSAAAYPDTSQIHQLFERQAAAQPQATALVCGEERVSYDALNRRANQVAHALLAIGVKPDERVAICAERGVAMVAGMLGVLKAGAAYVPLDPAYPAARLAYMLDDSAPVAVLTEAALAQPFQALATPSIVLDTDALALQPTHNPDAAALGLTPDHLAYVIYTSGSTGLPKGVMNHHRGLCNLACAQIALFGVDRSSRVLQFASFSFDACVSELAMALCSGAELHLAGREALRPGEPLLRTLQEGAITHVTLPSSALALWERPELLPAMTLVVAGDACPPALAANWSRVHTFFNAYGPTEATVCATAYRCAPNHQGPLPIGQPIANVQIHILDRHLQATPIGVAGEIWIGGVGVARGYLARPELTAERFVHDPFSGSAGARLYRSGDLGRWRDDGQIEFLGRNDFQVKVRGFRIELGEIEARLCALAGVREALVLAREDTPGDQRLVAYLIADASAGEGDSAGGSAGAEPNAEPNAALSAQTLREQLSAGLADYMIPSAFVMLDAFPLTPNGKVNRAALPAPGPQRRDAAFVGARNATEATIAQAWSEVLKLDEVSVHASFFDLGGNSLLIVQVHNRLAAQFPGKLAVADYFKHTTIAMLAAHLGGEQKEGRGHDAAARVDSRRQRQAARQGRPRGGANN